MKVKYNEEVREIQEKVSVEELFKDEIEKNKYKIVGCIVNNEYQNLEYTIEKDVEIKLVDISSKEGMKIYRNTLIYVMIKAFEELYPKLKVSINYQLANAMFCDIENAEVTEEILKNVYNRMKEIADGNLTIKHVEMSREEAKALYEKNNNSKGRLQYDDVKNEVINMYYCEDYYNYSYEAVANKTGCINLFSLSKYSDGFLIKYPSSKNPNKMPQDIKMKKLAWALNEYDDIHKILNINTVYKLNKAVKEKRIKDIIMTDEALHEKKIAEIAEKISKNKDVKMVLIAGPSSSGKTTFAQRLGIQLRLCKIKPVTISVDNYFVERKDTPLDENGEYNFEAIEAIDLKLFNEHLTKLLNGEEVEMPTFDFHEGTKVYKGNKIKLAEDEVLVIEGIHCLNDKLTSEIAQNQKYKIYISALTVLNMDRYNRISSTDTRLVRRIVRDFQFRGYSAQHTLSEWHKVNKGEELNIFPYQESANSIFNTSLIYELGALKDFALPVLEEIPQTEKEYAEARRIINILKYFESIPKELVPTNSLLKEFMGGGDFKY